MQSPEHARESTPIRSLLVVIGVAVLGAAAANVVPLPAVFLDTRILESPVEASMGVRALFMALNFVGWAVAGAIYLAVTDRGWSYVDLRMPTKRDALYTVGGIVGVLVLYVVAAVMIQLLSLPTADNQIVEFIGDDTTMILVMIGIVFFFNAPAEEFIFRNIVQKRLYEAFSRMQAVVLASGVFALVHFPVYVVTADELPAVAPSLVIIFLGSLVFGYIYAKTDNLLVPTLAHAAYNSFVFFLLYLSIVFEVEDVETATSVLWALV